MSGTLDFDFVPSLPSPVSRGNTEKNSSASAPHTYARGCNLAHRVRVVRTETQSAMKKNFLLIAILAGLSTIASAASTSTDTDVFVLPTYVVTAPRLAPAEQKIQTSLNELRRQPLLAKALTPDFSELRKHVAPATRVAHAPVSIAAKSTAKS